MRENRMDENVTIVYTAYITLRNGHRLYAKQYGKKAFEHKPGQCAMLVTANTANASDSCVI